MHVEEVQYIWNTIELWNIEVFTRLFNLTMDNFDVVFRESYLIYILMKLIFRMENIILLGLFYWYNAGKF